MRTKSSQVTTETLSQFEFELQEIIMEFYEYGNETMDFSERTQRIEAHTFSLIVMLQDITIFGLDLKAKFKQTKQKIEYAATMLMVANTNLADKSDCVKTKGYVILSLQKALDGFTDILEIIDESMILEFILETANTRKLLTLTLNKSVGVNEEYLSTDKDQQQDDGFLNTAKNVSKSIVELILLYKTRAKLIVSNQLEQDLEGLLVQIQHESSNYLACSRIFISYPKILQAKNIFLVSQLLLKNLIFLLEEIIVCSDPVKYYLTRQKQFRRTTVGEVYFRLRDEIISSQELLNINESLAEYIDATKEFGQEINDCLDCIQSPEIMNLKDALDIEFEEFIMFLPTTSETPKNINPVLKLIETCLVKFEYNINRGIVAKLITSLTDLSDKSNPFSTISKIQYMIKNRYSQEFNSDHFKTKSKSLTTLVELVLFRLDKTHKEYANINFLYEQANSMLLLVYASLDLFQRVKKIYCLEINLNRYSEYLAKLLKILLSTKAVFGTVGLLNGSVLAFQEHCKILIKSIEQKNDKGSAEKYYIKVAVDQFICILDLEAEYTLDFNYKQNLFIEFKKLLTRNWLKNGYDVIDSSSEFDELNSLFFSLTKELENITGIVSKFNGITDDVDSLYMMMRSPDKSNKEDFSIFAMKRELSADERIRLLAKAAESQDEDLRALTEAITDLVIINESSPKHLTKYESITNPIKAGGQSLKVEASYWDSKENPIIKHVNQIGQYFLELSEQQSKLSFQPDIAIQAAFISKAKDILNETNELIIVVDPLIATCVDQKLQIELKNTTESLLALVQTLKVLAAVKSNSLGDDDDSFQLISLCQNVTDHVKALLRNCIACSLTLENEVIDLIIFKKVIYLKEI